MAFYRWCVVNRKKLPNIKCFTYVFPCDFAKKNNEVEIFGTGGMILQNMKNLLYNLPGLETLELVDLQLDGHDGYLFITSFNPFQCICLQVSTFLTRLERSASSP